MIGTEVPMWSGEDSRTRTPSAPCGSSMIPAAMQPPITAAQPRARPAASATAPISARAYVMPAATWMTFAFSPVTSSTSTYWGSSVV